MTTLPLKEKKLRQKSPRLETLEAASEKTRADSISITAATNKADELTNKTPRSTTTTKGKEISQTAKRSIGATEKNLESESHLVLESELEKSVASITPNEKKHSSKSKEQAKKKKKANEKSKSLKPPDLKSEPEGKEVNF